MATGKANKQPATNKNVATTKPSAKKTPETKAANTKSTTGTQGVKAAPEKTAKPKTSAAKKTTAITKTTTAKAPAKKSTARKYSPAAAEQVAKELHEMRQGKLTIGRSETKVTNPKQAIAVGLAEARRAGKKVPPNPNDSNKK